MHEIRKQARAMHRERHAHLGLHHTSKHEGYAAGGHPHSDVREDRKLIKEMVKPAALNRAQGGRVHHRGQTHVNIMVGAPGGGAPAAAPAMPPAGGAPVLPPRPPVPMPPVGGPPPGIGGTAGVPPRKRGGRL